MKENITEEKAKEILDFLARKYGYINGFEKITLSEIVDKEDTLSKENMLLLICCVVVDSTCSKDDSLDFLLRKADIDRSYKSVLEFMLDIVSDGFSIGAFWHKRSDCFLKAHTTLEEILVEMDLKKIEEKNECDELQ